jgi:ParB family chromosome partitioning protein
MAEDKKRARGLGRGLSALMADVAPVETPQAAPGTAASDRLVPIERVRPNPDQPRRRFDDADLNDLASSIAEKGIIQPLIVRRKGDDFEIVAGERRWRAAQMSKLHDVPVIIRDFDDTEVLEIAIIENIQRADLNPMEEALGYRQLMDKFGRTQEKMAEALGKSRSHIANMLRLIQLPEDVQDHLSNGILSIGHARALITADDPSALAKIVIAKGLSVRETERLAKSGGAPKPSTPKAGAPTKDADTIALERDLSAQLGMTVKIDHNAGSNKGQLVLNYKSLEQLDELCRLLSAP